MDRAFSGFPKPFYKYSTAVLFIAMFSACSSPKLSGYATQTNLADKAKLDFNKDKIRESGKGFAVDMKKLGKLPPRIALVSFYVNDPGITKTSGTNSTGKRWNTTNSGRSNLKLFANEFAQSTTAMKASFAQNGMTLLTPDEFLTDNNKKKAYQEFVVQHTTLNKVGKGVAKFLKNMGNAGTTIEIDEAADGYELLKVNNAETGDEKSKAVEKANLDNSYDGRMIESLGYDLAKELGVDAVLVVYNNQLADTKWGKTRFFLSAVNMQLFGPNPLPLKEGKTDNNFYSKGLFYCGVRMRFSKGLLINPKIKDDALKAENDKANKTAYNNMIAGCAEKIVGYLKDELKN